MPRRASKITQADIARALRAAKQANAGAVEVTPDGTIRILVNGPQSQDAPQLDKGREIVL